MSATIKDTGAPVCAADTADFWKSEYARCVDELLASRRENHRLQKLLAEMREGLEQLEKLTEKL